MTTGDAQTPRRRFRLLPKKRERDVLAISPRTNTILNVLLAFFCILTLIPIYVIVISSVTSEASLAANGYRLWPEEFSGMAYRFLFSQGSIVMTAYKNTIISTVVGTIMSVIMVGCTPTRFHETTSGLVRSSRSSPFSPCCSTAGLFRTTWSCARC